MEQNLEERYFDRDLEMSTLDELRIWCRSLSLDDGGTADVLRERLREYYDYETPDSEGGTQQKSDGEGSLEIIIESADSTEYYQIEDRGEEIHLTGSVMLTVNDRKGKKEYRISADQIIFSRLDDSLTALGNVEYSRSEEGGSEERFLGESMTFHIEGWQGVIFDGVSSRIDTVEGEEIEFYFTGDKINSSGFDLAVMEKGTITSGKWEDPEYSIRAGKIWLLGPEEWGLVNGVLYLGRIPLLYLPFYYKPGNDLFFNPAIGYRTREGTTLQTTTYLLGQKSPENTSFFSAGLNSDSLYDLERRGFFLYKGDKVESVDSQYLKFMADWYSRLGGFVGLEGELTPGETSTPLELFAGLAVSRSIDDSNSYTVYYDEGDGSYASRWNSSFIGPVEIPFRWGSEISYSRGDFSLDIMYYSDPSFMGDFMSNRVENFDPLNFLLSDLGEDNVESGSDISSFDWSLNWKKNISAKSLSPWLSTINVSRFNSSLEWASITDTENDDEDSPTGEFFYPESVTLPDTALTLSGTLWQSGSGESEDGSAGRSDIWLFPEESGGPDGESAKTATSPEPYELPELQDARSLSSSETFSGSIKWSSSNTALLLNNFDNFLEDEEIESASPQDVSFLLDKGKVSLTNKDSLSLSLDFFDSLFSLDHSESFSITQRKYLNLTDGDLDLTDSELKDQYSYDSAKWYNSTDFKTMPLSYYALDTSYIKYSLGLDMFEKSFQSMDDRDPVYEELWLMENSESVSESELTGYIHYEPVDFFSATSRISTSLYTDGRESETSLSDSLSLALGPLSNTISHSLEKNGDEWTFDPVQYKGILDMSPLEMTFSEKLAYDVEEARVDSNTVALSGYGLSASLKGDYTYRYDWDDTAYTWTKGGEEFLLSSADISYTLDQELSPLWKNRIQGSLSASTGWSQNLIKINDSVLDFTLSASLSLHEFMDLKFSMVSSNENMYLYIPAYRDKLGITQEYNLFEDLARSFNIFNTRDREDSFFNLSSIELNLVHYMGNWNFLMDYSGSPSLSDGKYKWQSDFSFYLVWAPVPSLNIDVLKDENDDWDITAGETD